MTVNGSRTPTPGDWSWPEAGSAWTPGVDRGRPPVVTAGQEPGVSQPNRAPPHAPPTRPACPTERARAPSVAFCESRPDCVHRTNARSSVGTPVRAGGCQGALLRVRRATTCPVTVATRWRKAEVVSLLTARSSRERRALQHHLSGAQVALDSCQLSAWEVLHLSGTSRY